MPKLCQMFCQTLSDKKSLPNGKFYFLNIMYLLRSYGAIPAHIFNHGLRICTASFYNVIPDCPGDGSGASCASTLYRSQLRTQCHSRIWRDKESILAQVFSPSTRTQCPNMGNKVLIPIRQLRIPKTTTFVRRNLTGSLILTMGEGVSLYS
jgi:hypothetical protein